MAQAWRPVALAARWSMAMAAGLVAAAAAVAADAPADGPALARFSAAPPGEPPAAWRFVSLPNKQPTRFAIVDLDGRRVLKVEADASYGNLVHGEHRQPHADTVLAWSWRVDQLVEAADLQTRAGDDSPAKVCVFFNYDASHLSFAERAKLGIAHSMTGEDVPTETLCYVWDNKLPVDTALPNAFSKRIRSIVLESGSARLGTWQSERRSLAADYRRLFGDESNQVPEIIGIAVSADADNTRGHALAYFGDIDLAP